MGGERVGARLVLEGGELVGSAVADVKTPPVNKAEVILAGGEDVAGGLSVVVGEVEDGRVAGEVAPVEAAEGGGGPLLTTKSVCVPGVPGTALEGNEGTPVEAVVCPGRTLGPGNTDEAVTGDGAVALAGAAVAAVVAGRSGCAAAALAKGAMGAAGAEVAAGITRLVDGTAGVAGTAVKGTAGTVVGRDAAEA